MTQPFVGFISRDINNNSSIGNDYATLLRFVE